MPSTATSPNSASGAETINVSVEDRLGVPEAGQKFESKIAERQYLKERLAAGFRIFAKYGFDEGVAGHISLRDPINPKTFWVNPFGLHFALMKASDLILVDESGKVLEGGPNRHLNLAAYRIHSAVHVARPDVNCAAHAHSLYGRAFCAMGKMLDTITQDSCAFYNDHVLYENFNGLVMEEEEGMAIAHSLGNKKAALLQNHGLLTTGGTVEEAVFWFLSLEKCCHAQLLADAAAAGTGGTTKKIGDKEALNTWMVIGSRRGGHFSGKTLFDLIDFETNGAYKN